MGICDRSPGETSPGSIADDGLLTFFWWDEKLSTLLPWKLTWHWNIPMFNRKWHLPMVDFLLAMLVFLGVYIFRKLPHPINQKTLPQAASYSSHLLFLGGVYRPMTVKPKIGPKKIPLTFFSQGPCFWKFQGAYESIRTGILEPRGTEPERNHLENDPRRN